MVTIDGITTGRPSGGDPRVSWGSWISSVAGDLSISPAAGIIGRLGIVEFQRQLGIVGW
jgi:hypothetical protein